MAVGDPIDKAAAIPVNVELTKGSPDGRVDTNLLDENQRIPTLSGQGGKFLAVKDDGTILVLVEDPHSPVAPGEIELANLAGEVLARIAPALAGQGGKLLAVKPDGSAVELISPIPHDELTIGTAVEFEGRHPALLDPQIAYLSDLAVGDEVKISTDSNDADAGIVANLVYKRFDGSSHVVFGVSADVDMSSLEASLQCYLFTSPTDFIRFTSNTNGAVVESGGQWRVVRTLSDQSVSGFKLQEESVQLADFTKDVLARIAPSLTGNGGDHLLVNAGGTAVELVDRSAVFELYDVHVVTAFIESANRARAGGLTVSDAVTLNDGGNSITVKVVDAKFESSTNVLELHLTGSSFDWSASSISLYAGASASAGSILGSYSSAGEQSAASDVNSSGEWNLVREAAAGEYAFEKLLFSTGGQGHPGGQGGEIPDNSLSGSKLIDRSVSNRKIAAGSLTWVEIGRREIHGENIGSGQIGAPELNPNQAIPSLAGNAGKMLTADEDEALLEFVDAPDVSGLSSGIAGNTARINALDSELGALTDKVDDADGAIEAEIESLSARVDREDSSLEERIAALEAGGAESGYAYANTLVNQQFTLPGSTWKGLLDLSATPTVREGDWRVGTTGLVVPVDGIYLLNSSLVVQPSSHVTLHMRFAAARGGDDVLFPERGGNYLRNAAGWQVAEHSELVRLVAGDQVYVQVEADSQQNLQVRGGESGFSIHRVAAANAPLPGAKVHQGWSARGTSAADVDISVGDISHGHVAGEWTLGGIPDSGEYLLWFAVPVDDDQPSAFKIAGLDVSSAFADPVARQLNVGQIENYQLYLAKDAAFATSVWNGQTMNVEASP
ncbi:MAG: hypothetical protein OXH70_17175 [Acidobacteria bacterium]|nr:hypothetical protein [Acidobacteriota bacterium]